MFSQWNVNINAFSATLWSSGWKTILKWNNSTFSIFLHLINLLLFQDDLSVSFWLFPFVLWEIIYSGQVCAGTTTSILSKATKSFPSKPENLSKSKIGKSWEKSCAGRIANPVEENLGKSCTRRSALHRALLSSASSNWNHRSPDPSYQTIWKMPKNVNEI